MIFKQGYENYKENQACRLRILIAINMKNKI